MKHIFWILSSIMLIGFTQADEKVRELSFVGKWKSFEGEIISVSFNESNEAYFRRNYNNQLQSEGTLAVDEKFILIERVDSADTYKLKYAFSTDAQTLVVMKPYSNKAWLLNRISYY